MAVKATILYWKLEDVPVGDGEAPHPDDIRPILDLPARRWRRSRT